MVLADRLFVVHSLTNRFWSRFSPSDVLKNDYL